MPIDADTTETEQVTADPDGTFTLRSTVVPVRVQQQGAWVPIDPTLRQNADGSWSPKASAEATTFSDGGTTPLVSIADGTRSLAFSWPTSLPTPTVSGATATYASVLPGVDLLMTAGAADYSEVLVVHDATAAANPALTHIQMSATATGLTLSADSNNLLTATDANGTVVFSGSSPVMWDSHADGSTATTPTASDPGSGHISMLTVTASPMPQANAAKATSTTTSDQVTVTPPPAALTGTGVMYPLYIDPTMAHGEGNWIEVTSNGWSYWDQQQLAQVGDCGTWPDCGGLKVARSYFQLGIAELAQRSQTATIWHAEFHATEVHNAVGCSTPEPVAVDRSTAISSGTTWPGPDGVNLGTSTSSASDSCAAGIPPVTVTAYAQDAANSHDSDLNFALRAPNETDQNQWKKFAVAAGQPYSPELDITYSYPPNAATAPQLSDAVTCTGHAYTPDATPTLSATATDNNLAPLNLQLWFQLWNGAGTSQIVANSSPVTIGSGARGAWTEPTALGDADYEFRVNVSNNVTDSTGSHSLYAPAYSPWYAFTSLANPITQVPTISSTDYPAGFWGDSQAAPGTISFNANGASHVAGFTYTFSGTGTESVPHTTDCDYYQTFGATGGWTAATGAGAANVTIPTSLSVGYHTVYVRSFDLAHNLSPESSSYTFYVPPTYAPATASASRVEAENTTVTQPAGQGVGIVEQTACCGTTWSGSGQMLLQGTKTGQSFSIAFTSPAAGNYPLSVELTKSNDYGELEFMLNGTVLDGTDTHPWDGYSSAITLARATLGTVPLTAGTNTLTITVVGTDSASTGSRYLAGVDYVSYVEPTQLEAEDPHDITLSQPAGQTVSLTTQTTCCGVTWSSNAQELAQTSAINQSVNLTFTAPVEADYALGIQLTKAAQYGQLKFTLDPASDETGGSLLENTASQPFDGYSATTSTAYQPLGGMHLTAGTHTIAVTVVGKNTSSSNYQFGIDYLTAAPLNNLTASSFVAAQNNHGIATDNTTPANFDLVANNALSAAALTQAGYAPGTSSSAGATVTVDGASFTMPQANSAGNDNIIADGQTIPIQDNVAASAIGLLATTTCGSVGNLTTTVKYKRSDGSTFITKPVLPEAPDWIYGDPNTAAVNLSHIDNPAALPYTNRAAKIYALFIPVDPTATVQSITLPYTGTSMLPDTCSEGATSASTGALHILSIGLRHTAGNWSGAWAAPVDTAVPPPGGTGFHDQTIRMVVHPTSTGSQLRLRLSNADVATPTAIDAVTVAAQSGTGGATTATPTAATFGGTAHVTLAAGSDVTSDPITFPTGGSGNLVVSIHLPTAVTFTPIHGQANNLVSLAAGNHTADTASTSFGTVLAADYYLVGVDVSAASNPGTIAVLGDQTSAAGTPGNTYQPTWVDDLPAQSDAQGIPLPASVVNVSRAGAPPSDWWKLADGQGTTAADSSGTSPGTLVGATSWSTDHGGAVTFGSTTGLITTPGPVLDTTSSYSISAWAMLSATDSDYTVASQGGANRGGFYLQYSHIYGTWAFVVPTADSGTAAVTAAYNTNITVSLGTWTHLVGVFDAATSIVSLYVNGQLAAQQTDNAVAYWKATGPLAIGGLQLAGGGRSNFYKGSISDVRAYHRVITPPDIGQLFGGNPVTGPNPGTSPLSATSAGSALGGYTSPDALLNQTLLCEPNLRTVIVALGTNDVLSGQSIATIEGELTNLIRDIAPYGIKNNLNNDELPVTVVLTTIPPLGLAANDIREQNREAINRDIAANYATTYQADDMVNFDAAVADTNHPNQIAATYLTNGEPNDAYYQQLAQVAANATL